MRRLAVLLGGFLIFFIVFFSVHNLFQARRSPPRSPVCQAGCTRIAC